MSFWFLVVPVVEYHIFLARPVPAPRSQLRSVGGFNPHTPPSSSVLSCVAQRLVGFIGRRILDLQAPVRSDSARAWLKVMAAELFGTLACEQCVTHRAKFCIFQALSFG